LEYHAKRRAGKMIKKIIIKSTLRVSLDDGIEINV